MPQDTPLNLKHREPSVDKFDRLHLPWKILIVDDESEVHTISRLILKDLVFESHPVELMNAYSADQAKEILKKESDIALVIVDVVMETEQAGLELIEFIRKTLDNQSVRIMLRTGHPGQAPESQVIFDYDINDYKSKNELTARKLVTSVVASLRAYRTLKNLEVSRRGLEMILDSTASLFEFSSIKKFSHGVLYQLTSFLSTEPAGILCLQTPPENLESIAQIDESVTLIDELQVIGGLGVLSLEQASKNPKNERLVNDALTLAKRALTEKTSLFERGLSALYVASQKSPPAVAVLWGCQNYPTKTDFCSTFIFQKSLWGWPISFITRIIDRPRMPPEPMC